MSYGESAFAGVRAIEKERERQYYEEGFRDEHDDQHDDGQLAMAASCYAQASATYDLQEEFGNDPHPFWPWDPEWWKPGHPDIDLRDKVRVLAKAGALIAAEIDRLERLMSNGTAKTVPDGTEMVPRDA